MQGSRLTASSEDGEFCSDALMVASLQELSRFFHCFGAHILLHLAHSCLRMARSPEVVHFGEVWLRLPYGIKLFSTKKLRLKGHPS